MYQYINIIILLVLYIFLLSPVLVISLFPKKIEEKTNVKSFSDTEFMKLQKQYDPFYPYAWSREEKFLLKNLSSNHHQFVNFDENENTNKFLKRNDDIFLSIGNTGKSDITVHEVRMLLLEWKKCQQNRPHHIDSKIKQTSKEVNSNFDNIQNSIEMEQSNYNYEYSESTEEFIRQHITFKQIKKLILELQECQNVTFYKKNCLHSDQISTISYQYLEFKFDYASSTLKYIQYISLFICIMGIIGNILSSLVLLQKDMKSSPSYMLLGLTFFDTIFLIGVIGAYIIVVQITAHTRPDEYAILSLNAEEYIKHYHLLYKIYVTIIYPFNKTAYTGSVYTTLIFTVERYYVIRWPFQAQQKLTPKNAIYCIFIILIFSIFINTPRWFEYIEYLSNNNNTNNNNNNNNEINCMDALNKHTFYRIYYDGWFWTLFMLILPILIVGIFNTLIWFQSQKPQPRNNTIEIKLHQQQRGGGGRGKRKNSLTKMILTIIGIFTILNLLSGSIVFFYSTIIRLKTIESESISNFPIIINSSINFIIYCTLGQRFRLQFIKMLKSWKYFCHELILKIFKCICILNSSTSTRTTTRITTTTRQFHLPQNSNAPAAPTPANQEILLHVISSSLPITTTTTTDHNSKFPI